MIYQCTATLSLMCLVTLTGCSALFSSQEWSENYTLMEGTRATSPQMIDGSLNTIGETAFPAGIRNVHRVKPRIRGSYYAS